MAVFRVNKDEDFTIMKNYHFREKDMSLKAIGLLSFMLSLPKDWDYSIAGLVAMRKENVTAIRSTLRELEKFGYLKVTKTKNDKGQFEYIYDIFEAPKREKPYAENLYVAKSYIGNKLQLNTNKQNTNKQNTKERESTPSEKQTLGYYENVFLSNEEIEKLKSEFPDDYLEKIERLSEYIAITGENEKYKNHFAVIRSWLRKDRRDENTFPQSLKDFVDFPSGFDLEAWSQRQNKEFTQEKMNL